jgi:hypothetical protein
MKKPRSTKTNHGFKRSEIDLQGAEMYRIRAPHQAVLAITAFKLVELVNLIPFS